MTTLIAAGSLPDEPVVRTKAPPIRSTVMAAIIALGIGVAAFAGWAYLIPMSGGVVGSGEISVESNRREIQSKNGGTIKELRVKEGSTVEKGDVLVVFDRIEAKVNFDVVDGQYLRALARHDRLKAEINDQTDIVWSEELLKRRNEPLVEQVMQLETDLLYARFRHYHGRRDILETRISEFNQRLEAISSQLDGVNEQLRLTREEIESVKNLVKRGYEKKPRLYVLQRQVAEYLGDKGHLLSNLAGVKEGASSAGLELANLAYEKKSAVISDLTQIEARRGELRERLQTVQSTLKNTEVVAPESGTVVEMHFFGEGGVVGPGQPMFDLVPTPDSLLVKARVKITDIDAVYPGQPAQVRLLAYNQRMVDPVYGDVFHISADRLTDPGEQNPHYEVFIKIDEDGTQKFQELKVKPGMPADVVLKTEDRTFLEYLLSPVSRAMFLAFREE